MSTGTSTSTGPRLIAPDTAAATGLATVAVIAPAVAAIAVEGTAADTEVVAGIGVEAAVATADREAKIGRGRRAFLIVARQAAGL
jgi:hypothetical protein